MSYKSYVVFMKLGIENVFLYIRSVYSKKVCSYMVYLLYMVVE